MVLMYVTLFERQHQHRPLFVNKAKTPKPAKTTSPVPAVLSVNTRQRTRTKRLIPRKRRRIRRPRPVPRPVSRPVSRPVPKVSPRSGPARPKTALRPVSPPPIPRRVVAASVQRIAPPPPRLRRPKPRRVATTLVKGIVSSPQTPPTRWWGDVLSLELAAGGGVRWFSTERWAGGLQLQVGLNLWRWTIRAELGLHWFTLLQQSREILLLRPSFWGGWRIPLGKVERWLEMYVSLGLTSEVFVTESSKRYTSALQWGGVVGLQLHGRLSRRWSLWLRPSLSFFPAGLGAADKVNSSLTPVQVHVLLGVQVRL